MKSILLISHGSRYPQTISEVEETVSRIKKKLNYPIVKYGFLELQSPSINEGIDLCVQEGATEVVVLMNFLNSGRHVDFDVPDILDQSRRKHKNIKIHMTKSLCHHPEIENVFIDMVENKNFVSEGSLADHLIGWYKKQKRDLPWRKTKDPYKIWISEIMLQQTTVKAVIPYYNKWMSEFPTIHDVANASESKLLKMWEGLGYYSRVRNIHKAAKLLIQEHNGKIPKDPKVLKKLPGFGPYTVGAVLSIAYDLREPIIDGNVRRVLMRLKSKKGLADSKQDSWIYDYLDMIMPDKDLRSFNQAVMELGATICTSKNPTCLFCPIRFRCQAYAKGVQEIIPTPKKQTIKNVYAAIGVIESNGKYLIQQRPAKGLFADLWEFPGGKIEEGETPEQAVVREIKEETGLDIAVQKHLMNASHYYTQFKANLNVFLCSPKNKIKLAKNQKWVSKSQLNQYAMPSGSVKIVEFLTKL